MFGGFRHHPCDLFSSALSTMPQLNLTRVIRNCENATRSFTSPVYRLTLVGNLT